MERDEGFFRHHALYNRRLARHSGEDAGRVHGGAVAAHTPAEVKQRVAEKKAIADEQRKQKIIRRNVKKIAKNAKGKIPKGLMSFLG